MSQPQLRQPGVERSLNAPTLGRMLLDAGARTGVAIRFPRAGAWHEWTYADLAERARRLALGLVALGVRPGDRVAVLSQTRPEWTLVDGAILCAGAAVVPIYHTNSPGECEHVVSDSGARVVVCEDAAQLAKIDEIRDRCPDLEHVVTIDPAPGATTIDELAQRAADADAATLDEVQEQIAATDPATIVYTSGTTGPPKGCVLTHRNLLSTMAMYEQRLPDLGSGSVIFMFLPLAHVLARVVQMVSIDVGATLAFWSGDTSRLIDDVAAARPTHVPSVPRVFEKIHTRALANAQDGGAAKRRIFAWALATGRAMRRAERGGGAGPLLRARHRLADRLVLSRVRDLFGGRLELALSGAAPISAEVLEFFDACGVLVLEGYGLTESTAAATLNTPDAFRFGTVGRALPGTEVRIASDGEVLLRGAHVFDRYWNQPEATAEALSDGWLHTGDLGTLDDGFLRITGRKKELIITSSGKNVSPANLEAALRESRWLSQAVVYGDRRPYLVALVTLDAEEAPALAAELGVPADVSAMAEDERVQRAIAAEIAAVNAGFARIEQVKRFAILPRDLTQEQGDLTPTQKLRRNVVYDRYAERFANLYEGAGISTDSG